MNKISTNSIICLFAIFAFFIWFAYIDYPELSHDEPFSLYHSLIPVSDLLQRLSTDNNPPLYEICLHLWIRIFGNGLTTIRLFSTFLLCAALIINAKMILHYFGIIPMIISSAFFIFSNYYLNYAHEARGYALFLFLTIAFSSIFLTIYDGIKTAKSFKEYILSNWLFSILFVICAVFLLHSHYMACFVILAVFIFLIIQIINKDLTKNTIWVFILLSSCVLLLYFPQLLIFIKNAFKVAHHGTWLNPPELTDLYNLLWKFFNSPVATVLVLVPLLFISSYSKQLKNTAYKFMCVMFWIPFLLVFIISFKIPLFHDRYMIFISPFVYNLVAINTHFILNKYNFKMKYLVLAPLFAFMFSFSIVGKKSDTLQEALLVSNLNETIYVISPNWYNYNFYYYFDNGKYFFSLFDVNHVEPRNVIFDYNLTTFSFSKVDEYKNVNIILNANPNQDSFNSFDSKLKGMGYYLSKTTLINKVSKSYLYKK